MGLPTKETLRTGGRAGLSHLPHEFAQGFTAGVADHASGLKLAHDGDGVFHLVELRSTAALPSA